MRSRCEQRIVRALCALAALAAPALIACGSDDDGGTTTPGSGGAQASGHTMRQTVSAEIDEKPQGFVSSDLLRPVVNAWRASSRNRFTEVDAGALAADDSTGAFAIFRQEFVSASQDTTVVKVNGSGPLRITRAPLGRGIEDSAQKSGKIGFAGARGVRGTLHLSDDTVKLRKQGPSK